MPETQEKNDTYELLFGVHNHGENLFSAKIVKLKNGKIAEWKHGNPTLLGHAVAIAENLMGGYVVSAHETTPQKFYDEVFIA